MVWMYTITSMPFFHVKRHSVHSVRIKKRPLSNNKKQFSRIAGRMYIMSEERKNAEDAQEKRNRENEEIREMGTLDLGEKGGRHGIQLLTIIGEIEGHEAVSGNTKATKYEHLLPRLAEMEEDPGTEGFLSS